MVIIIHPEFAPGFRLAGVDILEVNTTEDAGKLLLELLNEPFDYGLIGISEDFVSDFDDKLKRKIEESDIPLVVPFPVEIISSWRKLRKEKSYVDYLIRSAIGYYVKLKKE